MCKPSSIRSPLAERFVLALVCGSVLGCDAVADGLGPAASESDQRGASNDPSSVRTHRGEESTSGDGEPDSGAVEPPGPQEIVLRAPTDPLLDPSEPAPDSVPQSEPGRRAYAWQFNAPIYVAAGSADILGFSRRGATIPVARARTAPGCGGRSWWELSTGGWVCPRRGWAVSRDPEPLAEHLRTRPAQDVPLPFAYAKVRDEDTPIYARMPTPQEQSRAESTSGIKTAGVLERTRGVVFLALHRKETREDGTVFLRDVRGRYVLDADTHPPKTQTMRAEPLRGVDDLPLAFVYGTDTALFSADGSNIGSAEKFARQAVEGIVQRDGAAWVQTPRGQLARASVRIAEVASRPEGVGPNTQWVHVDLDRQTLVAYEGDAPILATLVSSGKEGYEPPRGLFRIEKKYTAKKMAGADPIDGSYDIDQVPYTMYYWGSLALHGAYWHDDFGKVRSHGCTNLPPHDARWLFRWAAPTLDRGWHGRVRARGPKVYVTRGEDAYADPLPTSQRKNE